jgi:esterase/lipase superfamily enzyme
VRVNRAFDRLPSGARRAVPILMLSMAVLIGPAGCAGRPRGVLTPVAETAPGATPVTMLVATTRRRAETSGELYSGERGSELSFVDMTISIPPAAEREVGEVQWPEKLPGNPATDFVTLRVDPLSTAGAKAWVDKALQRTKQPRVLVFVHGYNNRFEDAVYRFAQITHDSGAPTVPILFTWPSRGTLLSYNYDRESANYSRDSLEAVLQYLAHDPRVGEVALMAHSMGNWVALEALRQMSIRDGRIAPKINTVILAAPDVDVDVFRQQITRLGEPRPKFTLFVSQDDRALAISRRIYGGIPRLGAINPDEEPYRSELEANKITVLDLTKLRTGDSLNHAKFAESPDVVRLIGQRLVEGQTITESNVGLGDRIAQMTTGAATAVGAAAGLVLSAPIAIVDQHSRENFGDHVSEFGAGVSETAASTVGIVTETPKDLAHTGRHGAKNQPQDTPER